MRVGIVGMHYSPEPSGNAPYTAGLASGLADRGHAVRVIAGVPHYPDWRITEGYGRWSEDTTEDDVHVTRLRHIVPSRPTSAKRILMEMSFGARVMTQRFWQWPDVVVAVSPALIGSAMAVARLKLTAPRQRPSIGLWMQDLYSAGVKEAGGGRGPSVGAARRLESSVARAVDGVAVIHDRFRDRLITDLHVPRSRVRVIRNWTHLEPLERCDKSAERGKLGWGANETIVLHAGNMGVKQGLESVVEAAQLAETRRLPVRFILLGGGNQRPTLERLGRNVRNLHFISSLPSEAFQRALSVADILLVNERAGLTEMSVPSKLTSYMTTGNPVVAVTDENSVTAGEIAASGAGVRVNPNDPNGLLETVMQLGRDKRRSAALGAAGVDYSRRVLSREAALSNFEDWLLRLTQVQSRGK